MPARRGEAWNDEDKETLRRMAAAGETLPAIALTLERTREATSTMAHRLKVKVRTS